MSYIRLCVRYDREKEKKYPTQMNDTITPGFLLLLIHTIYCSFKYKSTKKNKCVTIHYITR